LDGSEFELGRKFQEHIGEVIGRIKYWEHYKLKTHTNNHKNTEDGRFLFKRIKIFTDEPF